MKIKELKHNHSLTDLLKVLLFSILMLAPILAIGVKCAYVVINKNAKNSYSDSYITKFNTITNSDNLVQGQYYYLNYQEQTGTGNTYSPHYKYNSINIDWSTYLTGIDNSQVKYFDIRWDYANNHSYLYLRDTNNTLIYLNGSPAILNDKWGTDITQIYFNYDSASDLANINKAKTLLQQSVIVQNKLDNVFYYAIDEVSQEPLFNWTQNTAIYTGVNAMCTGMEITSPIIPILITYWFLLTCIYVIIDILIKGFTMLTHLIGSRIAE